jgi:hypothetical protein
LRLGCQGCLALLRLLRLAQSYYLGPVRRGRVPYAKLSLHFFDILFPPLLPINRDERLRARAASQRPRNVISEEGIALIPVQSKVPKCCRDTGHGKTEVGKFEELEGKFVFNTDRHVGNAVVEVVTFTVALNHVGELRVIDVMHLRECRIQACLREDCKKNTGSLVSGVTPQRSSHVMYARPKVPCGSCESFSMSTVSEFTLGRSLRILRPSTLSSICSRRRGSAGPPVVSPNAAIISGEKR